MLSALIELLPIAVAAALSTVPITITLVILLSESRSRAALPFLVGCLISGLALTVLATVVAQGLPLGRPRRPPTAVGVVEVVLGGLLVVYGAISLTPAVRDAAPASSLSSRMSAIESLRRAPAFGLGLLMNVRPKALLLVAAAGLVVRSASLGAGATAFAIAFYTLLATSTVVGPILASLVASDRAEPRLLVARRWIDVHGPRLTAGIVLVVGFFVAITGLRNLS